MNYNFSVKPILRTDKKKADNTCPIYHRVTINRKSLKLPYGESVLESKWNKSEGIYRSSRTSLSNINLEKRAESIKDFIRSESISGNLVTIEKVKSHFANKNKGGFYDILNECYRMKFAEISSGTKEHYELVKRRLQEYKSEISISEIDFDFIDGFDKFLKNKGIGIDGIWKHHKILKVVIRYAIKKKKLRENPYEDFKIKKGNPKFGYLTYSEIAKIENLEFEDDITGQGLELTRDLFLFGCYTGLRYSDIIALKKSDIVEGSHISRVTQKTKSWVNVPLMDEMEKLIRKYTNKYSENIFPYRSNQCCNRDLKIFAPICKIKKTITFHMSRHSFATNLITNNINPMVVSKLLGHATMNQTLAYVNVSTSDVKEQLERVNMFNRNK